MEVLMKILADILKHDGSDGCLVLAIGEGNCAKWRLDACCRHAVFHLF